MTITVLAHLTKHVYWGPTLSISVVKALARDAKLLGPHQEGLHSAFIFDANGSPGIVHLVFMRRPFAVTWAVVLIYIAPLYRHSLWALTHILKKVQECMPARTHANASTTIVLEQGRAFGIAARMHALPRFERGCAGHSVRSGSFADLTRRIQTSARFEISTSESIGNARQLLSTTASAHPIGWTSRFFAHYFPNGSQSTKRFPWLNWSPHMREFNAKYQAVAR